MNFKNIKYVALAFAAVAMTACDEKDADERYTYVPPVTAERGVLLEDFTGQACVNCPNATEEIHELQEHYGDKVVAVGIHSGQFSKKLPLRKKPYPLWTSVGDEYYNYWKISMQPMGIINRIQQVCTYHAYFIYDNQICSAYDFQFFFAETELRMDVCRHSRNEW